MPEASQSARSRMAVRSVVALFVLALTFTTFAASASPVVGADLDHQISSVRSGQLYSESLMRTQDRVLKRIVPQRKRAKKSLKRAARALKRSKKPYAGASKILRVRAARLKDAEARFPDAADAPDPANWKAKMIRLRRELRQAQDRRRSLGRRIRITTRNRNAIKRRLNSLKRAQRVAISRRDSAAAVLGGRILQMTRLAQQRATRATDVRLTDGRTAFEWPSTGTITQPFGCTGFPLNPPRGSCRYFHRGIDMVSGYGSAVRAAAVGVVAYVGWNPWDKGERAFIVVISHPGGFVTRYGHIVASRKVRAGQLVRKGQIIAKMGSTGKSTGTHLHMELLKGSTPLNPVSYLPTGVVKVRKHSAKKGKAAARRKASRRSKSDRKKSARATRKSFKSDQKGAKSTGASPGSSASSEPASPQTGSGHDATGLAAIGMAAVCPTDPGTPGDPNASADEGAIVDYVTAKTKALSSSAEDVCAGDDGSSHGRAIGKRPAGPAVRTAAAADPGATRGGASRHARLPRRGTSPLPQ